MTEMWSHANYPRLAAAFCTNRELTHKLMENMVTTDFLADSVSTILDDYYF